MVSYYNSLGSMFPASTPSTHHTRSQVPNTPSSAYFNPYAAASTGATNYTSGGSSTGSSGGPIGSGHHQAAPLHPSSNHAHPTATGFPHPTMNPQYNQQFGHHHHDLNSNMYAGGQFPGFDPPPGSPSSNWSAAAAAAWSSFPGSIVDGRYDWGESKNVGEYSPLPPNPNVGGHEGDANSESNNNTNTNSDPSPPSFNQSSSESPSGTPTPTNLTYNSNYSSNNPGVGQPHHIYAHLSSAPTGSPPSVVVHETGESPGGEDEDGNYSRSEDVESGGAVSLPASSLSPPPPPLVSRPQPARSPFQWMKKPAYNSSNPSEKSGRTRTKDKYRVVYSDHQRLELEKEFHYSRYITIRRKAELANNVGLSERQVKIWFQNRRAKERRAIKKSDDPKENAKLSPSDLVVPGSLPFTDAAAAAAAAAAGSMNSGGALIPNNIPTHFATGPNSTHFTPMKYE